MCCKLTRTGLGSTGLGSLKKASRRRWASAEGGVGKEAQACASWFCSGQADPNRRFLDSVSASQGAALTKYHSLGGLKQQKWDSDSLGGFKLWAEPTEGCKEASILYLFLGFWFCHLSLAFLGL